MKSTVSQLIFILVYWKCYPTQDLQGVLFDMTQSAAHKWIYKLLQILEGALGAAIVLPARPATNSLEQLLRECPELEFVIDGVERPIQRSHDKKKQEEDYSGKKKRHTKKNIVVTRKKTKKIVILGNTHHGKTHDKKAADLDDLKLPKGSKRYQDTGFQGYEQEEGETIQPKKKPRGGELSDEDKAANRAIAKERIGVEHSIGGVKHFRITADVFRNRKVGIVDKAMWLGCGLYNLKVECRCKKAA